MSSDLKIAITGKSGCGNTSVSKIVSAALGLRLINYTFHDMAKERGIGFEELCALAEVDSQFDTYLDNMLVMLASKGGCVLGSRLSIWLLKNAHLKVCLTAGIDARAQRIAQREKTTIEQAKRETLLRDERDRGRYIKLYGIDIDSYEFADLVIDTEEGDQQYVASKIVEAAKKIDIGKFNDNNNC
jgi:CMP/dCMP kinase